ncbi:hypothetical protein [Hymenobacter chitinivorans]|uniref:Sugar ABC transporter ATPase n=1 Tax=Hymenobacter chitinivorans DSM 11115 TaxID=1121954 RepID=A0A2M9APW0_9BACT|nr:hypothetical protein [Hymenobacter chitinivorans]PJJ47730.1 hypothetical protein CLV45_4868 [Hymenobacter chitinivorans DSM 11115]
MSDHSIAIVPALAAYPNKENKAREIVEWLIAENIVRPTLSACLLGNGGGYAIANGARQILCSSNELVFELAVNGLEVITERQVFDTGGNGVEEILCPGCQQNLSDEDLDFIGNWCEGETDDIICPVCGAASDVHQLHFTPEWGFSDLGFKFWNWPDLTEEFITRFQQKLGCPVSVVYQHI